jgi:hypothetical protein
MQVRCRTRVRRLVLPRLPARIRPPDDVGTYSGPREFAPFGHLYGVVQVAGASVQTPEPKPART